MFNSPFEPLQEEKRTLREDTNFIVVADLFAHQYGGGAELTTQALIDACPTNIETLNASEVTLELLEAGHSKHWIFGNCSSLNVELIPTIVANMEYSILEYDYKFCKYRSIEKHRQAEQSECDCHEDIHGKMISAFFYGAKSLWWMSENQMSLYHEKFPFLTENHNIVLSSVFDENFFITIKDLNEKYKEHKREGWIVLGSSSWIKGADDAEKWCKDNDKDYEVVWNLPYNEVLEKLARAEGFVYLPMGNDTCPRMVIEAAVVGFPHDIKGQGIYAFVTLMTGVEASDEIYDGIRASVTKDIGPHAKPDEIQFTPALPKTRSGKIMRRILRKIAEGDLENMGDISTLADPSVVASLTAAR